MPVAKGLYNNHNYSLILVLLYIDSRKQKDGEKGYKYTFQYNAPDISYNTGVGLKAVNTHLRMLERRGALTLITDSAGDPNRTRKGALKYTVVKNVYEEQWGPNSRGANVLNEGQSEPTDRPENIRQEGLSEPCNASQSNQAAGHPEPSSTPSSTLPAGQSAPYLDAGQSLPGSGCRAVSALQDDPTRASSALQVGHSGRAPDALRPGHSEPTNDNERIREEKSCAKREDCSAPASASPPLNAPASATASPAQKGSERTSDKKVSISAGGKDVAPSKSSAAKSSSSASPPSEPDPIDPHYGIPVSYVRRYEAHADILNSYLEDNPELAKRISNGSDAEAGQLIIQLLDSLKLQ